MSTVRDLITDALLELTVLAESEVPTGAMETDAFDMLNRLVDSWQAERLQIYTVTRTTWAIVSGDKDYTVGTGGNVNVLRPVIVDHINYLDTSINPSQEYPLTLLTDDMYAGIPIKDETSTFPTSAYYNPTFPLATIILWPVPTSTTLQGVLYAPQAVAEFTSVSQTVSLPPGYRRMIVKNLAMELAPSYGREPHPAMIRQAIESKEIVKRANIRMRDLAIDPGALVQGTRTWYGPYSIWLG